MLILAVLVVLAATVFMARGADTRVVLLAAAAGLALLAGQPLAVADTFTRGMVAPLVAPICAAMGFSALMTATGCDRHLVRLLLAPLQKVPWLLLPGGIVAAYLVNAAVPSQAATAAALGPILVPLLVASGRTPAVAGAALILGASFGGDLLNPGAKDLLAVAGVAGLDVAQLSAHASRASLAGLAVAVLVFTVLAGRRPGKKDEAPSAAAGASGPWAPPASVGPGAGPGPAEIPAGQGVSYLRALVPVVPILLLVAAYAGWSPLAWLLRMPAGSEWNAVAGALPVVRAMLVGAVLALVVGWRELRSLGKAFFEGMGGAYGNIVTLTITAQCFGAAIALVGLAGKLLELAAAHGALVPLAAGFPFGLAVLSGSGSGPILTFAQTFLPHVAPDQGPAGLSVVACLAGAFGRTLSPVSAVVVYGASLVGCSPLSVVRSLLPALLAGGAVALAVAVGQG